VRNLKKILSLAFLLGFLFICLLINFFHTEKTLRSDIFCPACHFLGSVLNTGQIPFFSLPPLILLAIFISSDSPSIKRIFVLSAFSRSPPQA